MKKDSILNELRKIENNLAEKSDFVKKKSKELLIRLLIIFIFMTIPCVLWCLPSLPPKREIFERKIFYKFIDMNVSPRFFFESYIFARKKILTRNGEILFVTKKDYRKIWTPSPHEMGNKNQSYLIKFSALPLLFGGYSYVKIENMVIIDEKPLIRK